MPDQQSNSTRHVLQQSARVSLAQSNEMRASCNSSCYPEKRIRGVWALKRGRMDKSGALDKLKIVQYPYYEGIAYRVIYVHATI